MCRLPRSRRSGALARVAGSSAPPRSPRGTVPPRDGSRPGCPTSRARSTSTPHCRGRYADDVAASLDRARGPVSRGRSCRRGWPIVAAPADSSAGVVSPLPHYLPGGPVPDLWATGRWPASPRDRWGRARARIRGPFRAPRGAFFTGTPRLVPPCRSAPVRSP